MSISTPFIFRPIATLLLTIGMALVGGVAYVQLDRTQSWPANLTVRGGSNDR